MSMTLAEARTKVRLHLDDVDSMFSDTEIDSGLKSAHSDAISIYVSNGGDRFDTIIADQPDSSGDIDVSTYDLLEVRSVSITRNGYRFQLAAVDKGSRGRAPSGIASYTTESVVARMPVFPTVSTNPLIANGHTWHAFESWMCVKAALELSTKDKEDRPDLDRLDQKYNKSVTNKNAAIRHKMFPSPKTGFGQYMRYVYDTAGETISICEAVW